MRTRLFSLIVAALTLVASGCATGFRAGGPHGGVSAGAAVGPAPAVYPVQPSGYLPAVPDAAPAPR